ncbi:potassium channel family protein [Luteibacter sp. ME-Dv--P-043b]|uniref:potassium channel family protein n=1 Tax=Luteibacter sp. ME-Dv--P-043b TaxID=3040291 RepID=UPI002552DC70|nr:potassium channel family protein [Luteibacter sp. ME-Dv--P-043b]
MSTAIAALRFGGVAVTIIVGYAGLATRISRSLVFRPQELPWAMALFAMTGAVLVIQFAAIGFQAGDLLTTSAALSAPDSHSFEPLSPLDYLYFSTMTFTSVGYGDLVPRPGAGRFLAICEAVMGSVHSVFFILIFLRSGAGTPLIERPTQAQDDKS